MILQRVSSGPVVCVIDDEIAMRAALRRLLTSAGRQVALFGTLGELLASPASEGPGCLLLDVRLPGIDGVELLQLLREAGCDMSVVFITGYGDVHQSVAAMKSGAVDFLLKPFEDGELLAAVDQAIAHDAEARRQRLELDDLRGRLRTLTPREREVLALVVAGLPNKRVAARLGTCEKTVKVHRARVMAKMRVPSLADLVRAAGRLGIPLHHELDRAAVAPSATLERVS
jgi:FixJ family two-component response regulator